jgi:hypothetical protein
MTLTKLLKNNIRREYKKNEKEYERRELIEA